MRATVLTLVALVFGALLLFDTTALIQLSWLCLQGQCGVSAGWVALGLGALIVACMLPGLPARLRWRGKPKRAQLARAQLARAQSASTKPARAKARPARPKRAKS